MPAESNSAHDVYEWIKINIKSCQTKEHLKTIHNLLVQFYEIYPERQKDLGFNLRFKYFVEKEKEIKL